VFVHTQDIIDSRVALPPVVEMGPISDFVEQAWVATIERNAVNADPNRLVCWSWSKRESLRGSSK
jgi:hypothetical protein